MIGNSSYKKAFYAALCLHVFLIMVLLSDTSSKTPAFTPETQTNPGMQQPLAMVAQPEIVKAVSVDSKQVMETVTRLKEERLNQQKAEATRQQQMQKQLEMAKQQRIKEQQHIEKLKQEANTIAIARKKQAEEEKKHLKELAEEKALEAKRIKELQEQKKQLVLQQEKEAKQLEVLKRKKLEEKAAAEKLRAEKIKSELAKAEKAKAEKAKLELAKAEQERQAKAKAELERKKQAEAAAAQLAHQNAERQAHLAGEVDKYKALIVNAIGRNWILPENANSALSSQFRIRLAPDGAVLEVTLTRSSGDALLDRSAQTAIYKASPLPVPTDADTFNLFRDISLTVRPEQVRG